MDGFSDTDPVYIRLDTSMGYGNDPIEIEGLSRLVAGGIMVDAADGNRHWIPDDRVLEVLQVSPNVSGPPPAGGEDPPPPPSGEE